MHPVPLPPIYLRIYNGILLIPGLLFALKAWVVVSFSSVCVMCCVVGVARGVYYSVGSCGSKNRFSFCLAKSSRFSALRSWFVVFSILQNFFG